MAVRYALPLLALFLLAAPARAQPTAGCALGEAEGVLDAAGVRATLYNIGGLFWRGRSSGYEVPKGSGRVPLFNASLLVGGLVDGEVRHAGSTYGPWEYWPGPLAADGTTDPATCAAYDRVWVVRTADLAAYEATGTATPDLAEWPVAVGAPFYTDANGNGRQDADEPTLALEPGDPGYGTRTLDLAAGERPVVFGRQTAWWVMNDAGGPHEWSGWREPAALAPLGIEVRATAWVHGAEGAPELSESTFYRFEVVNRSPRPIETAHAGLYIDGDLGNFNDDRVGTDSTRQMVVFHNGDEVDEGGSGYGARPPALGIAALSGGWAGMTPFKNGPGYGEAVDAATAYNYLRGLWRDGTPVTVGGIGYDGGGGTVERGQAGDVVRWAFPGDVVRGEFWSQENIDGAGDGLQPSDKYGILSGLPADLAPGERMVFDVGILFASGLSRLDSVTELREASDLAQSLYAIGALTRPIADPAPPAPPAVPEGAETVTADGLSLSWGRVPGAEAYQVELFTDAEAAEPYQTRFVRAPATALFLPAGALPLNRRDPLFWRVRAVALGVPSEATAARPVEVFYPGFSRYSVVANAAGPLDPPVVSESSNALGFVGPGADRQQTIDVAWGLSFAAAPRGDAAARAYPHDFEMRFPRPRTADEVALVDSTGARLAVPFEVWDIGVGTPDDPADDVRLIPVVLDGDRDGRLRLYDGADRVVWARPRDARPGEWGFLAETGPEAAVPDSTRWLLPPLRFSRFNRGSGAPDAEAPEAGTVFRLESSAQALPVAVPEAPATLAVEVRPNPTATRATVAYRLAADADVRLRVVDVLGREVAVLAEGPRVAGAHTAALDAARLASGVYVVELVAGEARAVRTITVAR